MHVTYTLRRALLLGGAALLAVVALIAWTHRSEPSPAQAANNAAAYGNPEPVSPAPQPVAANPGAMNAYGEPVSGYGEPANANPPVPSSPVVYAASPFAPVDSEGVAPPPVETAPAAAPLEPEPMAAPEPVAPVAEGAVATAPARHHYYHRRRRVVVVRKRPFRRSAEIVAGSAAGGALIGGLAGGAKGAGIGALAAGAGGLVYDRLTHKKKVVVTR